MPGIHVAMTRRHDMRSASRVVSLIKRDLALYHVDEDRTRVGMPAGAAADGVVMGTHHHIEVRFGLCVKIDERLVIRFDFEGLVRGAPYQCRCDPNGG